MNNKVLFKGRQLLIATKHEKEKVIAPILEKELGVECFVPQNLDTDSLGTFTGEIERVDDPISTARKKCLLALQDSDCDLVVSNEGSFGQHPSIFFSAADDEFLLFMDRKNNLEIIVRELSTDTNFNGSTIKTTEELHEFVKRASFPSHGLILRKAKDDFSVIVKGIRDTKQLRRFFNEFIAEYGSAYIETDMRAMYNPTRMRVIKKASEKLAEKINTLCPACSLPGFGITDVKQGLPCNQCYSPTRSTLSLQYKCQKCSFVKEEKYPNKKLFEDPTYCDHCNP